MKTTDQRLSTQLFPFHKRNRLPRLEDLSKEQRAALPSCPVTHLEWVEKEAFGRPYYELHAWMLGARGSIVWREKTGRWE